jgi:hypothetical protein
MLERSVCTCHAQQPCSLEPYAERRAPEQKVEKQTDRQQWLGDLLQSSVADTAHGHRRRGTTIVTMWRTTRRARRRHHHLIWDSLRNYEVINKWLWITEEKSNYLTYAAGFGGSMDVRAQELGSEAWRDGGLHRSVEADTVQEAALAYMLAGLVKQ